MSTVIDFFVQNFDTLSDVVHEVKYFVIALLTPNQNLENVRPRCIEQFHCSLLLQSISQSPSAN